MKSCFTAADILLPNETVDMGKWAVVACDQYTSQKEYWDKVYEIVEDAPSTLHLICPEYFLGRESEEEHGERIDAIHDAMRDYLLEGALEIGVKDGFVLVERKTPAGVRLGILGKIDLEAYDYRPEMEAAIRATEGTVVSRIPARVAIRDGAGVELPHVMVLIDDPKKELVEPLYEQKDSLRLLYDTKLMQGGGHLRGYAVEGEMAESVGELLGKMEAERGGFFLSVGDGNHSLASAKAFWEQKKKEGAGEDDPARYALVEVCNLHSDALVFAPIHRLLTGVNLAELKEEFEKNLAKQGMSLEEGGESLAFVQGEKELCYGLAGAGDLLPVDVLQRFLDAYLEEHPEAELDYIHGDGDLMDLVESTGGVGMLLYSMRKEDLFPAIQAGGVLPRKTFSIGEAYEKRYYVECRKIQ